MSRRLQSLKTYATITPLMAINVNVTKNNNENANGVLRRFVKKVRSAGFLQEVRGRRYYTRDQSKLRVKRSALVRNERTAKYEADKKSGKIMADKESAFLYTQYMSQKTLSNNIAITNETQTKIPAVDWVGIKNTILGKNYQLSLVFPSDKTATELHEDWKNKPGPANILSFPLEKNLGEIFISLSQAKTECKKFDRSYENYVAFLFIHGCAHLKGHIHGSAMEAYESKIRKKFGI